jgi:hypothetical protein
MKRNKIKNISDLKLEFFIKEENSEDKLVLLEPGSVCFSDGDEMTKSMKIFLRKNLLKIESGEFPVAFGFSHTFVADISKLNPSIIPEATPNSDEILNNLHTTNDVEYIFNKANKVEDEDPFEGLIKERNDLKNALSEIGHIEVSVDWAMENILGINPSDFEAAMPTIDPNNSDVIDLDKTTTQSNLLEEAEKQAIEYKEEPEKKVYKYNYKKKPGRKKKRGPKPGAKKKKLNEEKNAENNEGNE